MSEIATLQRIAGDNFFKVRAFERASWLIADMPEAVDALIDSRAIYGMDGIGESIEAELQSLRTLGFSPRHRELLTRIGPGVLDLMQVNGLGMRRLQVLFQELNISDVKTLKTACVNGTLHDIPHFGEGVVAKLLIEIEHWERTRGKRYPLPEAKGLADSIRLQLAELDAVDQTAIGGSIRRGKETIGDIDILITTDDAWAVSSYFKQLPEATEVVIDGDTRCSVRVVGGIQVDLRVLDIKEFGAGLHYFTGSKDHHIRMRIRSKKMGLKISEHGVVKYNDPDEVPVGPMANETQIFNAVGLPYIPPEIRMGKDEIPAAEKDELPDLVEISTLSGDTHTFSKRSGGTSTMEELVNQAVSMGYSFLVVSERAKSIHSKGIDDRGLREHLDAVARINEERDEIRVVSGVVVDIDQNGMLGLDHRLLAETEFVIGVTNSHTDMDAETMTQRMLWGLETGLLCALGSPTCRRLGSHDGIKFYFDEIVDACVDYGVAMEMSGHPSKLDLNATNARRAKKRGAKIVVCSEAGSVQGMQNVQYSVQQAKRAWFQYEDVLNCEPIDDILSQLRTLRMF